MSAVVFLAVYMSVESCMNPLDTFVNSSLYDLNHLYVYDTLGNRNVTRQVTLNLLIAQKHI
jgi:hypothetical protein